MKWVSDFIRLPEDLRVRTPLSISKAHLLWENGKETSFSGDLNVQKGPQVSLNLLSRPGEFIVKPLVVIDAASNASLLFELRKNEIDWAFKGHLEAGTLDALFKEKGLLRGSIRGDLGGRFIPGQPLLRVRRGVSKARVSPFPGLRKCLSG